MNKKWVYKILALGTIVLTMATVWAAPLKVGVTAGPHAIIMEKVKEAAGKAGLDIQIVEFNDFILPNRALNDGELDINSYQHQPFLDEQNKAMGYHLVSIGKTVLMPLGLYPGKVSALGDLKEGDQIAIPNDPTNAGRALKLLEQAGLLKLNSVDNPTPLDIAENTKNLKIVELEAPQLPRSLADVAMAVINTDWVILSDLDSNSALIKEPTTSPYTNVLVIKEGDVSRKDIAIFLQVYQSDTLKAFILEQFKGAVLPAW